MRVLLTGHEGYIGSILVPWLWARHHEVIGLDSGLFRQCTLRAALRPVPTIAKDVRDAAISDFEAHGRQDPRFARLAEICAEQDHIWNQAAEEYVLAAFATEGHL